MGLIEGVARGSIEPARLLTLSHTPPGVTGGPVLGLIGKGVTFDTGGISIKPADMMDRMKDDMAGGAAVITAMRALSLLEAPIRVRRRRAGGREHAGRQGAQARRRDPRRQRQDRRGAQHRRRGTPDPRRRALVRARRWARRTWSTSRR